MTFMIHFTRYQSGPGLEQSAAHFANVDNFPDAFKEADTMVRAFKAVSPEWNYFIHSIENRDAHPRKTYSFGLWTDYVGPGPGEEVA